MLDGRSCHVRTLFLRWAHTLMDMKRQQTSVSASKLLTGPTRFLAILNPDNGEDRTAALFTYLIISKYKLNVSYKGKESKLAFFFFMNL